MAPRPERRGGAAEETAKIAGHLGVVEVAGGLGGLGPAGGVRLGQGGFGAVWLAEQSAPVRRQVALKILKLGMDTREVIARLPTLRQAA